jgi:hypothetical protein
MVVNDYAGELDKRGALESIASRLAPMAESILPGDLKDLFCKIYRNGRARRHVG